MLTLCILALVCIALWCVAGVKCVSTWLEKTFLVLLCVVLLALGVSTIWREAVEADYEQVTVMVATESGVIEVDDEDYYKDDAGDYYTIVGEEKALWVPFYMPTFEKVEAPVFEYDNFYPQPPTSN